MSRREIYKFESKFSGFAYQNLHWRFLHLTEQVQHWTEKVRVVGIQVLDVVYFLHRPFAALYLDEAVVIASCELTVGRVPVRAKRRLRVHTATENASTASVELGDPAHGPVCAVYGAKSKSKAHPLRGVLL